MPNILKLAWNGDLEAVREYLDDGGDPNYRQCFRSINDLVKNYRTPLFCAVDYNGKSILEISNFLLERGAEPNGYNVCTTPLVVATLKRNKELIDLLNKAGARRTDLLELILAIQKTSNIPAKFTNEDFTVEEGGGSLHLACIMGDVSAIKAGIRAGLDRNREDIFGNKPVHHLTLKTPAVFSLFKSSLLNVNGKDRYNRTLFHRAARGRDVDAVKGLRRVGVDPNIVNRKGTTALFLAVQHTGAPGTVGKEREQLEIVNLLLAAGAVLHPKKEIARKRLNTIRTKSIAEMVAGTVEP
jgi:ankyrin repeat protein